MLAEFVYETLNMDKIIFIPTNQTPLKEELNFSAAERYEMVRLAIAQDDRFDVSDVEIKREGVSYTYDTILQMKTAYQNAELYLIIGYDNFMIFDKWYRYEDLMKMAKIVVLRRFNAPAIPQKRELIEKGDFIFLQSPVIDITSTQIRQRLKEGKSIRYYVPDEVYEFIRKSEGLSK